jgi:serine/threonine-protein kinase
MSPEQIVGAKTLDHRTDLWSLGVVAFQALTGVRPFTGETQGAVLLAVCTGEIPKPSTLNAELTPALDAWFAKACARDPDKRFHSARVMAAALEEAVGSAGAIPETGPATIPDNALDATVEAQPPGSLLRELGRAPIVRTSTTMGGGTLEQGTAPRAPGTSPPAGRLAAIGLVVAVLLGVAFMMRTKATPTPTPAAPTPSVASAEARPEPAVVESATASASSPASASVSVAPPKPAVIVKPAPAKSAAKPPPATAPTKPADEVIE